MAVIYMNVFLFEKSILAVRVRNFLAPSSVTSRLAVIPGDEALVLFLKSATFVFLTFEHLFV